MFRRFAELGSARQVLLSLRGDGLLLPRRPTRTGRVHWAGGDLPGGARLPDQPGLCRGVRVRPYPYREAHRPERQARARTVLLPRDQWEVLIPDHHAGFIDWDTFEANTARLRENWRAPRGFGGGAARERVGVAARPVAVRQVQPDDADRLLGREGQLPAICVRPRETALRRGERLPEHGRAAAGAPGARGGVRRPRAGRSDRDRARHSPTPNRPTPRRCAAFELTVERARYEAARARRQYDAVEPENRLVARTLERALEDKLAAQRQAERDLAAQRPPTGAAHRRRTGLAVPRRRRRAGGIQRTLAPRSGNASSCCAPILTEVVVTVDTDARTAASRSSGKAARPPNSTMTLTKAGGHFRATDEDTVELVRRLAEHYDDTTIALILARQRRRTGTGLPFTKSRVQSLRVSRGIPAYQPPKLSHPTAMMPSWSPSAKPNDSSASAR